MKKVRIRGGICYLRCVKKTELAIFDLDGTLLDTIADLGNSVNHILSTHGMPLHTIPDYKKMVGRGMRNLVKAAIPETSREDGFIDSFLKEFLDWYMDHIDKETLPYPGIPEMMKELDSRGVRTAVASNKVQRGTVHLIKEFFPEIPFVAICGNSPGFPLKPDAAIVNHIMEKAGTSPETTIMVGDSETDIRTAHNAGIPVVAVTWGFRPVEDLAEADYIVDSTQQILKLF